jgi:hypothetical protein
LILSGQQTIRWAKEDDNAEFLKDYWQHRTDELLDVFGPQVGESPTQEEKVINSADTPITPAPADESVLDKHPYLKEPFAHFQNLEPIVHKPEVPAIYSGNPEDFQTPWPKEDKQQLVDAMKGFFNQNKVAKDPHPVGWMYNTPQLPKTKKKRAVKQEQPASAVDTPVVDISVVDRPDDYITHPVNSKFPKIPETAPRNKAEVPFIPEALNVRRIQPVNANANIVNSGFGLSFPNNAKKGDMFLRVDQQPNRLYKYNGNKWIEVDKERTDSYTYDDQYINYLIEKLKSGEYDIDQLSATEQELVAQKLQLKNDNT